jgi:hypothetical protein
MIEDDDDIAIVIIITVVATATRLLLTTCSVWAILRNGGSDPASHPAYRVLLHMLARLRNAHKYLHHESQEAAVSGKGKATAEEVNLAGWSSQPHGVQTTSVY